MEQIQKYISSSVHKDNLNKVIDLANELHTGIEISRFPDYFNIEDNYAQSLKSIKSMLEHFEGNINLHAFFFDLIIPSYDKYVVDNAVKRYNQSLNTAIEINAKTVVFHTGFNAFLKCNDYKNHFYNKTIEFWSKFITKFEENKITAVLENVQEQTPDFISNVIDAVNSPYLKASIDVGHANLHSNISIPDWIKAYNKNLHHMHFHSNFGDDDSHSSIKSGNIDFNAIINAIKNNDTIPKIVFEIFEQTALRESILYFDELMRSQIINKGS